MSIAMDEKKNKKCECDGQCEGKCEGQCGCDSGRCDDRSNGCCGTLDKLPPRLAFWAGVVVTAGTLFGVAFIVLLVMMFKGVDFGAASTATTKTTTTVNADTNTDTTAQADTNQAQPAGKVDPASLRNIRGEGDYTIIEYSDTECPFCKRFHSTMLEVMDAYTGKVRWAYKHLPLTSLHSKARREALATECAAEQGKFWEYIDLVFERTTSNDGLADEELFTIADDVGVERTAFDSCLESEKYKDIVSADSAEAQKLGGRGTPYAVIIDQDGNVVDIIEGALPYESVAATFDAILQ